VPGHGQDGHGTEDGHATAPPVVNDVLSSPGTALDPATRAYFEPRFGHDFSRVRVHTDVRAAQSAAAVNAHAYTLGSHVAFGTGQYSPGTERGRGLLAHELTHVVQQSAAANPPSADIRVGPPGDSAEKEADHFAEAMTRPEPAAVAPAVSWHGHPGHARARAGRPWHASWHQSGADLMGGAASNVLAKKPWSPDVPEPVGRSAAMLRRKMVVNPASEGPDVLRQFNFLCKDSFSLVGNTITQHCDPGKKDTPRSCECLCDATHDPNRTYTISAKPMNPQNKTEKLPDGSDVEFPSTPIFPETHAGTNPEVIVPAAGSKVEFGSFAPDGHAEWTEDWRILEHELCGHARTGGGGGPIGKRPLHDFTIDIENTIAAEHDGTARGKFDNKRQGESFQNPVGDQSRIRFLLKDGLHVERPPKPGE
jgi:hypothetical protein